MRKESLSIIQDVINSLAIAPTSTTHIELATKIAERALGVKEPDLGYLFMDPRKFSVGEFCPRYALGNGGPETLRGKAVYILVTPGPYKSPEESVERACMAAVAAKENEAEKVVLLATDLPHGRQDRGPGEDEKAKGELNTVRWHARQFEAAGIDHVITTHQHSSRLGAFFALEYGLIPKEWLPEKARGLKPREIKVPEDVDVNNIEIQKLGRAVFKSISPHAILADYILHQSFLTGTSYLENEGAGLALKSMDSGNKAFIDALGEALFLENTGRLYCSKARKAKNDPNAVEVEVAEVSDNFETLDGKIEIYADDGLDTGGTMLKAVDWSRKGNICVKTGKTYGIPEERLVYFTHAWLGGESHLSVQKRLCKNLPAKEFVTTNTRPYISDSQYYRFKSKATVLRFAGLWADAILANELGHDLISRYVGFESEEQQHQFLKDIYTIKRHSRHFMVEGEELERRKIEFKLRD